MKPMRSDYDFLFTICPQRCAKGTSDREEGNGLRYGCSREKSQDARHKLRSARCPDR